MACVPPYSTRISAFCISREEGEKGQKDPLGEKIKQKGKLEMGVIVERYVYIARPLARPQPCSRSGLMGFSQHEQSHVCTPPGVLREHLSRK